MSFQKCPICLGTGDNPFMLELPRETWPCPTCKGARIISEITGLPPIIEEKHNIFEPVDPCESDIQHKWVCDLMQNRNNITPTQTTTQNDSHIQTRESHLPESGS